MKMIIKNNGLILKDEKLGKEMIDLMEEGLNIFKDDDQNLLLLIDIIS
jgi:hypothetical protein